MRYQHKDINQQLLSWPAGKIICVGQNYADHITEMGSKVSSQAVFFIKPSTAACSLTRPIAIPAHQGACHHETELALLVGKPMKKVTPEQALTGICGFSVSLDLTLRDLQAQLKQKGHPWERAKGFDGAAPLGPWIPYMGQNLQQLNLKLTINGRVVQQGSTELMLRDCASLVSQASECFTLQPGDVLLTGTPAGVGPLHVGDKLHVELGDLVSVTTEVILGD